MSKLVLVEGIPGAGKSSTCQFLRRALIGAGRPVEWWHEEQRGHPVDLFGDGPSLRATMGDLAAGRSAAVVERALEAWARFAHETAERDEVVLIDSCLYGYLTWTLFWFDVPADQIARYVAAVEAIVRPLDPRLVYLRQDDVGATLAAATDARGNNHRELYVERAATSPYGQRRGLAGLDGMVAYWAAYHTLTDDLFERSTLPRRLLPAQIGWSARQAELLAFLGLTEPPAPPLDPTDYLGWYEDTEIRLEDGHLVAYDLPDRWHRLRLVPLGDDAFDVESLPHRVTFERDDRDHVVALRVTGPPMLVTPALDRRLLRRDAPTGNPPEQR
jgi:hypothetical protein